MKKQLILVSFLALTAIANAQNTFPTGAGSNVGIGTTSPASRLEVLNTSNQLRLSYSAAIFSDLQTTSSGYLYVNPTGGRIGLGTNAPGVGFHSNLGIVRFSDPGSATRLLQIVPNYAGSGNLPAGILMSSALSTSGEGVAYIPTGSGTAGVKLGAYAFAASAWQPVWETQNVASGYPSLLLLRNGGNVGIGTASPTKILEISTAVANDGIRVVQTGSGHSTFRLDNTTSGGRNYGFVSSGAGSTEGAGHFMLYDYTANQYRLFFSNNGNTGINTTTPANKLDMVVTAADDGLKITQTTNGSSALILNNTTAGGKSWSVNSLGVGNAHGAGNFSIYDGANSRIFISGSTGNVGIGTTSPAQKLDVAGNINTNGIVTIGSNFILNSTGAFKNSAWAGTGNRLLVTNATGDVSSMTQGTASQVLYGTGTWGSLPASVFTENGNDVLLPAGKKLGIGTPAPSAALDVTGDANIRGSVVVGNTMGLKYIGADSDGHNYMIAGKIPSNVTLPSVPICPSPAVNMWWMQNYGGYISSHQSGLINASLQMYTAPWNGSGFIEVQGLDENGAANNSLNMNYFCGRDISMCMNTSLANGGGKVYVGNYLQAQQQVKIGDPTWSIAPNNSPVNNIALELFVNNGKAVKAKTWSGGLSMFEVENIGNNQVNTTFKVTGDGVTSIGSKLQTTTTMLTVGQASKSDLAFALTDNSTSTNKDFFTVQGNGYTEIRVESPTTMPAPSGSAPRVLAIKDIANTRDLFVVTATGKVHAREVEISLIATFPDYVFSSDYKLKSISDVADFIKMNKHLPGFEKGEYYEKNGINVNEMLIKQQEKMEEMMLYIIELEKRLKEIEKK